MKFTLSLFLLMFIFIGCESKNHILFSKNQELTNIINNSQKKFIDIKSDHMIGFLFYFMNIQI